MLKSENKLLADRTSAVVPNRAESLEGPSTPAGRRRRAIDGDDRNEPVQLMRFVTGGRAILLLSLACWAALLGAALLLFG